MGHISDPPVFIPRNVLIPVGTVGQVLTVISTGKLGFAAGGGSGGGLPGRYTATLAGATSELSPAGYPGTDTGSRIILTCTANSLVQTMNAGNDGQMVFLWNNTTVVAGFSAQIANNGTGGGAVFLVPGSYAVIPPQSGQTFVYDATLAAYLIAY